MEHFRLNIEYSITQAVAHPQDSIFDTIPDFRLQGLKPAGTAEKSEERYAGNNQ
jgi:hypothetical protein